MSKARDRWLARRRKGVGASEAAMLLGLSKWGGPTTLWARKLQLVPPLEETRFMQWGNLLEPVICRWFSDDSGWRLHNPGRYRMWFHPGGVPLFATPDRIIPAGQAPANERGLVGPGVLDVKNADKHMGVHWVEAPPIHYVVQSVVQMMCTGYQWGVMAVLIGGNDPRWVVVRLEDHQDLADKILVAVSEFWTSYVEPRVQPAVDSIVAVDLPVLKQLHPDDNGETVELTGDWRELDAERQSVMEQGKALANRKDELDAKLRAAIGPNTYAAIPGGVSYSLKTNKRGVRSLRRTVRTND